MGISRIKLGRAGTLVGLASLLVIIVGTAQAGPATKEYFVDIVPTTTAGTYTLILANAGGSTHTLGSANVTVPDGFTLTPIGGVAQSPGKTWSIEPNADGSVIELRAGSTSDALAPGTQVSRVFALQGCSADEWLTEAKQSNDFNGAPGNGFTNVGDPVTVTSAGPAATLEFVDQPTMTQVDTEISPDVKVEALDACGNAATGTVMMAVGTNPAGAEDPLDGTLTQPLVAGVATFDDLTIDTSGVGYTLSASSGAVAQELSTAFNIVDFLCTSATTNCELTDQLKTTTVRIPVVPSGGKLGLSFDEFADGFSCDGAPSFSSAGSLANIDPVYPTNASSIPVTMRWSKSAAPGTGVANFTFCWSKTGDDYRVAGACTKWGQLPDGAKLCELKRNRNGVGELVIEFLIAPEDPYAGLGD